MGHCLDTSYYKDMYKSENGNMRIDRTRFFDVLRIIQVNIEKGEDHEEVEVAIGYFQDCIDQCKKVLKENCEVQLLKEQSDTRVFKSQKEFDDFLFEKIPEMSGIKYTGIKKG